MGNAIKPLVQKIIPAKSSKKGCLTVVGSGIRGVGQISLEAMGWIRRADKVLYCVADPVTEVWIRKLNPRCEDLYMYYADDKRRIVTYSQMAGRILKFLREGLDVCAVFYGHPGIFVMPSHEAIRVARSEGYRACMLPAISAEDCLFADLGIDPSRVGCQTLEATDFLLRKRPLCTSSHVLLWQVGCVGDVGFKMSGYDGRNLGVLLETLQNIYGRNYKVVLYQAAQYPVCRPSIKSLSLSRITKANVTGLTTMYIPPKEELSTNPQIAKRLGLNVVISKKPSIKNRSKNSLIFTPQVVEPNPPLNYVPTSRQGRLAEFISDLSCDPRLLAKYLTNPDKTAKTYGNLSDFEIAELGSRHAGRIRVAVKSGGKPRVICASTKPKR